LTFLRNRIPSRSDVLFLFLIGAFPIHIWAIVNLLHNIPALVLRLSAAELMGVIAYTLVFALFESVLLLIVLIIVSLLLPTAYFKDKIVVRGFILVFLTSLWVIPVLLEWFVLTDHQQGYLLWTVFYFSILILLHLWLQKHADLETKISTFAERLAILSSIYVCLDALGVVIVVIRNVL
jgi:hypothetical protein